jgi:hypothetical protein
LQCGASCEAEAAIFANNRGSGRRPRSGMRDN